tara:strand:+ start:123 stop:374 length:252 start_codon:yes stop_codon:yes gene_type:complete
MVDKIALHRGGLLRDTELVETGAPTGQNEIRSEFVMAFCRNLIRGTGSWDLLLLSAYAAKDETGGTTEEMRTFLKTLRQWKQR